MALKGVAIIFMILLHISIAKAQIETNELDAVFANWDLEYMGRSLKICVGIYTFLCGFGYAFVKTPNLKQSIRRIVNLLKSFWVILLFIFLPIALISGRYEFNTSDLAYNMFGLKSNLNYYSWYVYFYIYAMLLLPLFVHLLKKYPYWAVFIGISAVTYGIEVLVHSYAGWDDSALLKAIFSCMMLTPLLLVGYLFHYFKGMIKYKPILMLFFFVIVLRHFGVEVYDISLDTIYVPLFCIAILMIINRFSWLNKLFIPLGKASMNMWFLHALFFTYVTRGVCQPLILVSNNIVIVAIWTILLTYILSYALMAIEEKVSLMIQRVCAR